MTTTEEWDVQLQAFVVLRNDIEEKFNQIQCLVANLTKVQKFCLTIWETRENIPFEIREEALVFFVKNHAQCLYFLADMVQQYRDGRLIRFHDRSNQLEQHKTDRLAYFDLQLNNKDQTPLTLLSLKGFDFERLALKKRYTEFKVKSNALVSR
jgi:hypothetical protein